MTPDQLLDLHNCLCGRARDIMVAKNHDYRGGTDDPFANFRGSEFLGVDPIVGILMRCMDKFQRIRAFVATGNLAVKSESVEDAIVDVINYAVLVGGMVKERQQESSAEPALVVPQWTLEEIGESLGVKRCDLSDELPIIQ